nr:hypothetical protein [uncultured Noviherbaspirillum sp.]
MVLLLPADMILRLPSNGRKAVTAIVARSRPYQNANNHPFIKQNLVLTYPGKESPVGKALFFLPSASGETQWTERKMLRIAQLTEINILRLMDYGLGLAHRLNRTIVYK